jgi:hypothetical protein
MAEIEVVAAPAEMPLAIRRRLLWITLVLAGLTAVHDLDHFRQGRRLPLDLYGVAVIALVTIGATFTLLLWRHRLAGMAAFAQGVATIVGVGAVHVAPKWSSLADSYSATHADALSWVIILAMMLCGLALAVISAPAARQELRASRLG